MNNQAQNNQQNITHKKLKILLHFLKEEIQESNYKLFNTKRSFIFNKLRLYIKDNYKKKDTFLSIIEQSIDKGIESKSLNTLMIYKKLIQALAYSQFTDAYKLAELDAQINNYIFDQDEDPFIYYNTKVYQIILNNRFLFKNRRQLLSGQCNNHNDQVQNDTQTQYNQDCISQNTHKRIQNSVYHQDNQQIEGNDRDIQVKRIQTCQNEQQSIIVNHKEEGRIIELERNQFQQQWQCDQYRQENLQQDNEQEVQNKDRIIENKLSEDIRLEELFTYIFPTKNDICHQLTELENIVFLMSMATMKQYKQKLKCTMYGSYMMGFQLSKSSDIDVSLEIENNPSISDDLNSKRAFLKPLIDQFQQSDSFEIFSFINAQVPGFQIRKQSSFNSSLKVKVDFTVGNNVGIAKTSLLKIYSSLSIKVQQLVCLFKYFIQVKNIEKQMLSSIAQTNMVIFFLLKSQYLPNVQDYFAPEQKENYLTHQLIDEIQIKNSIEKQNLLEKINSTPLFNLFTELISYYHQIVSQQPRNTVVISLLDPPASISNCDHMKYPFIIKEFYDDNHSVQPNPFFNFFHLQTILNKTYQFLQKYDRSTQLTEFINQIFSYDTQHNITQKYKQDLINEFNLDINSSEEED